MLPRRSAAEVAVDEEHGGALETGIVEWVAAGLPIVLEEMPLESFERHCPEKPRRDDAVRIDVVAAQYETAPEHS